MLPSIVSIYCCYRPSDISPLECDFNDREVFHLSKAQQKPHQNDIDHAIAVLERAQWQTSWAIFVFKPWCEARGESTNLLRIDTVEMEEKLFRFILEARWQDRETYTSKTIYGIVASIQRYLCRNGRHEIPFLNTFDPTFARLRETLDTRMRRLLQREWELQVFGVPITDIPFTLCSI